MRVEPTITINHTRTGSGYGAKPEPISMSKDRIDSSVLPDIGPYVVTINHNLKMDKVYGDYTSHGVSLTVQIPCGADTIEKLRDGSMAAMDALVNGYVIDSINRVLAGQGELRQVSEGGEVAAAKPKNPFAEDAPVLLPAAPGTPAADAAEDAKGGVA